MTIIKPIFRSQELENGHLTLVIDTEGFGILEFTA
jgi:hypothetical protein